MTHTEAISQLMTVAGELVRCEGIPDPQSPKMCGLAHAEIRREAIVIRGDQIRRAKLILDAVEVLRKA